LALDWPAGNRTCVCRSLRRWDKADHVQIRNRAGSDLKADWRDHADAAHSLYDQIKGGRVSPATIIGNGRNAFVKQALGHSRLAQAIAKD